jgi:outer membrane protein TolC
MALLLAPSLARCAPAAGIQSQGPVTDDEPDVVITETMKSNPENTVFLSPPVVKPDVPDVPMPGSLRDLIVAALNTNLELRAKRLDPAFNNLTVDEAMGAFDPQFNFNSLATHDEHPQNAVEFLSTGQISYTYEEDVLHYEAGFSGMLESGMQWNVDTVSERANNTFNRESSAIFHPEYTSISKVEITQPLLKNFGPGANLAEVRMNKSTYLKSVQDYRETVIKTIADVMGAYFELVFGQENLKVKQEAVTLAEHLVGENQHRLDQGRMAPIDVTDAEERLSEAQEELILAKNFLAHRRDTIRELTRETFVASPADDDWFVDGSNLLHQAPQLSRWLLLKEMFDNNPGYLANLELVKQSDIRLTFARNQRWPSLDLKASMDYNGLSNGWDKSYTDFRNRPGPDWTAGVVVAIPLTGRSERDRVSEAKIRRTQALYNVKRSENELLSAFDTAMRDIEAAQDRIQLVHSSVILAQDALASEEKRLESGLTTSYNVSLSQKDLSQARSRELATYVDLNKSLVQLYVLVGILPKVEHVDVKLD